MKSIRFFLSIVILSTITIMAFLAALNGYNDSMASAEELFDTELVDKANLLAISYSVRPPETRISDIAKFDQIKESQQSEQYFAFQIWKNEKILLTSINAPQDAIAHFESGFHYKNFLNHRWRTYSQYNKKTNIWILTAERIDIRYVLAENIVLETIIPVVIMLPFLGLLIWTIITYGLSPLRNLAQELGDKRADDLTALSIENQPVELIQVVNSTNDLFERLKASFLREKRFSSDAAHELRTPISAIKIHLHNLSHLISEDEQSFIQLRSSVDRMGHLIEQILNLNRTSTEQYMSRFSTIDLYSLAQEVIASEYKHFAQKNLQISLEGDSNTINGDKFSLELLVQNLISNACKYTPESGEVLIKVYCNVGDIIFQIEDSGSGIPVDKYERLFDRFYRLDGDCHTSNTIGCGLGLAIVKQIVELHHAEIFLGQSSFKTGLMVRVVFSKEDLS